MKKSALWVLAAVMLNSIIHTNSNSPINIQTSFIKQNYFGNENIEILISIRNFSNIEKQFLLSDVIYQSFSFELRSAKNELIPINPIVEAQMNTTFSDPSLYRNMILAPNETFSRIFNLREFYDIKDFGIYYIKMNFYPDPDNKAIFYTSDLSSFTYAPPLVVQQKILKDKEIQDNKNKEIARLLPNEVIVSLFESQLQKDWEKFLLHIDPTRLIFSFDNYAQQYKVATNGVFKLNILEKFKRFLTVHWNIPLVGYEVLETVIKGDRAEVTVNAVENIRFTNRMLRYRFSLYRNASGQWLIEEYTVLSLN